MVFKRADRVGDLIREIIGEMLRRDLGDPRLAEVTLTGAEVSPDLKLARIFFSAMGDPPREADALKAFQRAAGYIKKRLGRELHMRYVPDLVFKVDRSFDYGSKIDRLLRTVQKEEDEDPQPDR